MRGEVSCIEEKEKINNSAGKLKSILLPLERQTKHERGGKSCCKRIVKSEGNGMRRGMAIKALLKIAQQNNCSLQD